MNVNTYLAQVRTVAKTRDFTTLPQLLSLPTLSASLQSGTTAFFTNILEGQRQLPTDFPFADVINAKLISAGHLWMAIVLINTASSSSSSSSTTTTITPPLTTLTPALLTRILDALNSAHGAIIRAHEGLLAYLKQNIVTDHNNRNKLDSSYATTEQWHPIFTSIYSHYRLTARLLDMFSAVEIDLARQQGLSMRNDHDDGSDDRALDFQDLQLISNSKNITALSNSLKSVISTIHNQYVYEPIVLSSATNAMLAFFSYHSTQIDPILRQLKNMEVSSYHAADRVQYHYCIGYSSVSKKDYSLANWHLTCALQLAMAYPSQATEQFSIVPNTNQVFSNQQLHNMRLIIRLLCPIRLLFCSGKFTPATSLITTASVTANNSNPVAASGTTTATATAASINDIFFLDGIFSPAFLASIGLPIFAELSRSVMQGDLYIYNYLLYTYLHYFIASGAYPVIQRLQSTTWLQLFSSLHNLLIAQGNPQPHVIRWEVVLTALAVQKRRAIAKIQTINVKLGGGRMIDTIHNNDNDPLHGFVLEDYDAGDIECAAAELIYNGRIKAYFKPAVALVMAKQDTFAPGWGKMRDLAMTGQR